MLTIFILATKRFIMMINLNVKVIFHTFWLTRLVYKTKSTPFELDFLANGWPIFPVVDIMGTHVKPKLVVEILDELTQNSET